MPHQDSGQVSPIRDKNTALITQQDMINNLVHCEMVKHVSKGGHILRWAVLTTKNGTAVVGRPSITVVPNRDDPAIATAIAISNSELEMWPLMYYTLKQELIEGESNGI